MKTKPNFYLGIANAMTVGSILQITGTIRYFTRHHDDSPGRIIFLAATVLFVVLTTGCYIQWRNAKQNQ